MSKKSVGIKPSKISAEEACQAIDKLLTDIKRSEFEKSEMVQEASGWKKWTLLFSRPYLDVAKKFSVRFKDIFSMIELIQLLSEIESERSSIAGTEEIWKEIFRLTKIMETPRFVLGILVGPSLMAIEEGNDKIMRQLSRLPER